MQLNSLILTEDLKMANGTPLVDCALVEDNYDKSVLKLASSYNYINYLLTSNLLGWSNT